MTWISLSKPIWITFSHNDYVIYLISKIPTTHEKKYLVELTGLLVEDKWSRILVETINSQSARILVNLIRNLLN